MKKKKLSALILPVIALIFEILPDGVAMRFAAPPGEPPIIVKTSYFNLLPLGYADFAPLFTAILTVLLLIILFLYAVKSNPKLLKAGKTVSLAAAVISLCPVFFASYTVIGGFISVSLLAEFLYLVLKKPADTEN